MNVREAVGYADAMGASVLVPMHWDLFSRNTGGPVVVDEAAGTGRLHVLVMRQLEPFVW
jgi:L-ascorbate metabolism protein UlaG (beta-lactamase superfamily)